MGGVLAFFGVVIFFIGLGGLTLALGAPWWAALILCGVLLTGLGILLLPEY